MKRFFIPAFKSTHHFTTFVHLPNANHGLNPEDFREAEIGLYQSRFVILNEVKDDST